MSNTTVSAESPAFCEIQGQSDFYGLGIRLGLYFSFFTATFARIYGRLRNYRLAGQCIILATFLVILKQSRARKLYGFEGQIVMWMLWPQLGVFFETRQATFLRLSDWVQRLLGTAFIVYEMWFWWRGLDVLPKSVCGDEYTMYNIYGFFFTKVSLYHWFRTWNKIVWICFLIGDLGRYLYILGFLNTKKVRLMRQLVRAELNGSAPLPAPIRRKFAYEDQKISGYYLAWMIPPGIAATELSIKWNHIRGVQRIDAVGQLIPLLLGIGQLVHFWVQLLSDFQKLALAGCEPEPPPTYRDYNREFTEAELRNWVTGAILQGGDPYPSEEAPPEVKLVIFSLGALVNTYFIVAQFLRVQVNIWYAQFQQILPDNAITRWARSKVTASCSRMRTMLTAWRMHWDASRRSRRYRRILSSTDSHELGNVTTSYHRQRLEDDGWGSRTQSLLHDALDQE